MSNVISNPILDQHGRPFNLEEVGSGEWKARDRGPYDQYAVPHILTFQQLWNTGWRSYWHGQADEAVRHDREAALAMRRDSFLMGLLRERKYAVHSLPWHLDIPNERDPQQVMVRDVLTYALRSTRSFQRMRWSLLEAIWYGKYGVQMLWKWREINGYRVLCPRRFKPVNGDKIGFMFDETPYVEVFAATRGENDRVGDPARLTPQERDAFDVPNAEFVWTLYGKALVLRGTWRERFIIHQHELEDRDFQNGEEAEAVFGVGVRDVLFALDWMKREWLGNISDYFERVGQGLTLWKWDASNPASKSEVEKAARDQSNRVNILVPTYPNAKGNNNTGVERIEVPVQGSKFLMEMIQYLDNYQRLFVTGQTMSIGADNEGGLGGTGRAEFAQSTKQKVTQFDAGNLDESLTGNDDEPGFLSIMKSWSFPWADFPVWFKHETRDPKSKDVMEAIKTVVDMKIPTRAADARAAAGLSKPAEDDELIPMPQEQPAGPQMFQYDELEQHAAISKSMADEVYHQLSEDYPKASLEWVHHAAWEEPRIVPFSEVNMSDRKKWRASHEPGRVSDFADKIKKRLSRNKTPMKKPAVVVYEPGGKGGGLVIDGHHRTLGSEEAGEKGVYAWVGHVGSRGGPWMELHDKQFTRESGSARGSGNDNAEDQIGTHARGEPCKKGERADKTGCNPNDTPTAAMPVQPPSPQGGTRAMPVQPPASPRGTPQTRTLPGPLATFPTVPPQEPGPAPTHAGEEAIPERDPARQHVPQAASGAETPTIDQTAQEPAAPQLTAEEAAVWRQMTQTRPMLAALMNEDPNQWRQFNERLGQMDSDALGKHARNDAESASAVSAKAIHVVLQLIQAKTSPGSAHPELVRAAQGYSLDWLTKLKTALESNIPTQA